jgi:hypothetical protein
VAVKERLSELALQAPDLSADCRLGGQYSSGRPRELAFFGDRHEVPELAQIHNEAVSSVYRVCLCVIALGVGNVRP